LPCWPSPRACSFWLGGSNHRVTRPGLTHFCYPSLARFRAKRAGRSRPRSPGRSRSGSGPFLGAEVRQQGQHLERPAAEGVLRPWVALAAALGESAGGCRFARVPQEHVAGCLGLALPRPPGFAGRVPSEESSHGGFSAVPQYANQCRVR
jgi:hypothetical protein